MEPLDEAKIAEKQTDQLNASLKWKKQERRAMCQPRSVQQLEYGICFSSISYGFWRDHSPIIIVRKLSWNIVTRLITNWIK